MSTGKMARKPMSRSPNHRPNCGRNFATRARTKPIREKSNRSESGTNQMKCRLIECSRLLVERPAATMRVPTSSKPLARPKQPDSARMSRGRSRVAVARNGVDALDEVHRSDGIATLNEKVLSSLSP
jgi:hypothetical protein